MRERKPLAAANPAVSFVCSERIQHRDLIKLIELYLAQFCEHNFCVMCGMSSGCACVLNCPVFAILPAHFCLPTVSLGPPVCS